MYVCMYVHGYMHAHAHAAVKSLNLALYALIKKIIPNNKISQHKYNYNKNLSLINLQQRPPEMAVQVSFFLMQLQIASDF